MNKDFRIGRLYGSYFTCHDPEAGEVFRNVAICRDDINGGFTCVRAIILAAGRIPPECGELEIPGLPEFLNAEPDDMGQLVCRETGETISWGDLA